MPSNYQTVTFRNNYLTSFTLPHIHILTEAMGGEVALVVLGWVVLGWVVLGLVVVAFVVVAFVVVAFIVVAFVVVATVVVAFVVVAFVVLAFVVVAFVVLAFIVVAFIVVAFVVLAGGSFNFCCFLFRFFTRLMVCIKSFANKNKLSELFYMIGGHSHHYPLYPIEIILHDWLFSCSQKVYINFSTQMNLAIYISNLKICCQNYILILSNGLIIL